MKRPAEFAAAVRACGSAPSVAVARDVSLNGEKTSAPTPRFSSVEPVMSDPMLVEEAPHPLSEAARSVARTNADGVLANPAQSRNFWRIDIHGPCCC